MLTQFIEQLSRDLGISIPSPSKSEGPYKFSFDSELEISIVKNDEGDLTISTLLAPLAKEHNDLFLQKLLFANLFGKETGGGILGIDGEGKNIIFLWKIAAQSLYRDFYEAIELFINYAEAWSSDIRLLSKPLVS